MEPEAFKMPEEIGNTQPKKNVFFRVTSFSKYLAMFLFVALPFVGGWIGYVFAPEKVVEVESVVVKEVELVNEENESELFYAGIETKFEEGKTYGQISASVSNDLGVAKEAIAGSLFHVTRIGADRLYVQAHLPMEFATQGGYVRSFLMNDSWEVIREITEEAPWPFRISQWVQNDVNSVVRVSIIGDADRKRDASKVVLYDFVNNHVEELYEEKDPNVQLASSCELGCNSLLFWTGLGSNGQSIIVGRHRIASSTMDTIFIEAIEIKLPEKYQYVLY